MAVAMGTAMAVMGGIQLAGMLGSTVFSFFKSRKAKKKAKQMAQMNMMRQQQMMAQLRSFQGGNMYAMNGMQSNFLQPAGMMRGGYGPAPQGYYPHMC